MDGKKLGMKYFSDVRDIALSMLTDGFPPFDNLHMLRYVFHGSALSSARCVSILQRASEGS